MSVGNAGNAANLDLKQWVHGRIITVAAIGGREFKAGCWLDDADGESIFLCPAVLPVRAMLPQAVLLIGILLSSTEVPVEPTVVAARERYVAARQEVDTARRDLSVAQTRLAALKAEQRLQAALAAARPAPPPQRNPEFDRAQADVRMLDLQVRKLSERLAPAHPELITAEAELDAARGQLARIPEYLDRGLLLPPEENVPAPEFALIATEIEQAASNVRQAEDRLTAVLEVERQALAVLLTLPQVEPSAQPETVATAEIVQPAEQQFSGWIMAGLVSATLLVILIASRSRADIAPPATPAEPVVPTAPPSRRLIYSESTKPSPTANATKSRRTPVIPRRRVS